MLKHYKRFYIFLFCISFTIFGMDIDEWPNKQRIALEMILRTYVAWCYDDLVNASHTNKMWYAIIRTQNIGAVERKKFLAETILKLFTKQLTVYIDGFTFHPSGSLAGFLWRKSNYSVELGGIGLQHDNKNQGIKLITKELCFVDDYQKSIFNMKDLSITKYHGYNEEHYIIISKPFFIKNFLASNITRFQKDIQQQSDVVHLYFEEDLSDSIIIFKQ